MNRIDTSRTTGCFMPKDPLLTNGRYLPVFERTSEILNNPSAFLARDHFRSVDHRVLKLTCPDLNNHSLLLFDHL